MENVQQSIQARREQLAKWRASRRHELSLPSGLNVTVKDATIMDLVIAGNVPQSLNDLMMKQAEDGGGGSMDLSTLDGTRDFGQLVNALLMVCVVEPPVAYIADDDHLGIDEIPGEDKMAIFNWANREAAAVREAGFQPADAGNPA
jgi:hypothetical protein